MKNYPAEKTKLFNEKNNTHSPYITSRKTLFYKTREYKI